MHDHLAFAIQALRAGANGYVTKSSDPQLMVGAVRRVLAGEVALSPDLAARWDVPALQTDPAYARAVGA